MVSSLVDEWAIRLVNGGVDNTDVHMDWLVG